MTNDNVSLSHTKWNCKYHIVFAPKYHRQEIYGRIKADVGKNTKAAVPNEGSRDNRSRGMFGSYPHAGEYTTASECISICGISERKKFANDL